MKYRVIFVMNASVVREVEADSPEEAIDMVDLADVNRYGDGGLYLHPDHITGIEVIDTATEKVVYDEYT